MKPEFLAEFAIHIDILFQLGGVGPILKDEVQGFPVSCVQEGDLMFIEDGEEYVKGGRMVMDQGPIQIKEQGSNLKWYGHGKTPGRLSRAGKIGLQDPISFPGSSLMPTLRIPL